MLIGITEYKIELDTAPPPPPVRETYNCDVSGVPSHWVPFYGSAFGLFYDPVTDMFAGDGPPRRCIHRPRDCSLPSVPNAFTWFDYCNAPPRAYLDSRHLQSRAFAVRFGEVHLSDGETRFFCFCVKRWRTWPHRCPSTWLEMPLRPTCIFPRGWLPYFWISRNNKVTDRDYLEDINLVRRSSPFAKLTSTDY